MSSFKSHLFGKYFLYFFFFFFYWNENVPFNFGSVNASMACMILISRDIGSFGELQCKSSISWDSFPLTAC